MYLYFWIFVTYILLKVLYHVYKLSNIFIIEAECILVDQKSSSWCIIIMYYYIYYCWIILVTLMYVNLIVRV